MTRTSKATKNLTGQIIAYECGELNDEATIDLFQNLLDTGMIYSLQGHYQRVCQVLINSGAIKPS